jgi:pyridinium-3,5-bisthiocarboxylic acid mononucleotide nickel chelatase
MPPVRIVWFHCFAGIAGDMALGSLLDAGADLDEVLALLKRLPFGGWSLDAEPVLRNGIAATKAVVRIAGDDSVVRTHAHLVGIIEEARLPEQVRNRSLAVIEALARAEGRLHRRPVSQVHFHEVGGHDALIDVVGTCAALEVLGVERVTASPVATGTGVVRTSHGVLPNPPPAVVELLQGIPTEGRDINVELTTPTGAALLAATASAFGPLPAMVVEASGFGAGTRELPDLPNLTQAVVGTTALQGGPDGLPAGQPAVLLEANLDDATGETLAHTVAVLLDAGAYDAWITPVIMKKGRPGQVVSVLADEAVAPSLISLLRDETGSLGARRVMVERWPVPRSTDQVEVEGLPVRVKVSPGRVKAEHDDAARVARRTGLPLREVVRRAEAARPPEVWHLSRGDTAGQDESDPRPPSGPPGQAS